MGIEGSYRRVIPQEFEQLLTNPAYAVKYFGYDLETVEFI
jgi:hypothetical protein